MGNRLVDWHRILPLTVMTHAMATVVQRSKKVELKKIK